MTNRLAALALVFTVLLGPVAVAQTTIEEQIQALQADTITATQEMLDGKITLEEAEARMSANLEKEAALLRDRARAEGTLREVVPHTRFVSDLRLDDTADVAREGDHLRLLGVPLDFSGRVLLRNERQERAVLAVPDTDQLDFDPLTAGSAWRVALPYGVTGPAHLKFEGLGHPALDLEIAALPEVTGTLEDRFGALREKLDFELFRLGWTADKAVAALKEAPFTVPQDVVTLATVFFAFFDADAPFNLQTLLDVDIALAEDPARARAAMVRLFDAHLPEVLLHDRGDAILPSQPRIWRANAGTPPQPTLEELLAMLESADKIDTLKSGVDGVSAGSSLTGAGSALLGGPGAIAADLAFAAVSSTLRDHLHNSPRNIKIEARFADTKPRAINDTGCIPLVVTLTAESFPKIDFVYSSDGSSAELMAKVVVALVEASLFRHAEAGGAPIDWAKRHLSDAKTLNRFAFERVHLNAFRTKVLNPKITRRDGVFTSFRESLGAINEAGERLRNKRIQDWQKGQLRRPDRADARALKTWSQTDTLSFYNKLIKKALRDIEARGGPALEMRRIPAKTWGPYTLTPKQVAKYVTLSTRSGAVSIDQNGCITTCWRGRAEPFSVDATFSTERGTFGYGYAKASSVALGEFAPVTGRIAMSNPGIAPGQASEITLEMDGALPGNVRFSVPGGKGSIPSSAGMSGTFLAPATIDGCSQSVTVTAQLDQGPMCAPAPVFVGHVDVRDPNATVFMPQELVCNGPETLAFPVYSPSGEASCAVAGAGSVGGAGGSFTFSCDAKRRPAQVSCTDSKGGLGKACSPVMNIRYAKSPGIAAAAAVGASVRGDYAPEFSAFQLLKPRLPVLADTEPPTPETSGGGVVASGTAETYREPTPESGRHFESVAAPVRADGINLYRADRHTNANWHTEISVEAELRAAFRHDDGLGLTVQAWVSEEISTFESNDNAKSPTTLGDLLVDFAAFIPIDEGGPEVDVSVLIDGRVSGSSGLIAVGGHVDRSDGPTALSTVSDLIRIVPDTPQTRLTMAFETGLFTFVPFGLGPPSFGRSLAVEVFRLPEAPIGTPRGILVMVQDTPGEREVLSRTPGVIRNSPALLGRGTMISTSMQSSISLDVVVPM